MIMILSLFNAFSVPVMISFDKDVSRVTKSLYDDVNYVVDFFFFIDIIISFRTAFIDDRGNEECRTYYMAREYIQSTFPIDVIATVPFDTVIGFFNKGSDG